MVWLALLIVTTCWLMRLGGIFLAAAIAQGAFWIMFVVGAVFSRRGVSARITFAYQFVAINAAALIGFLTFLRGKAPIAWETNPPKLIRT